MEAQVDNARGPASYSANAADSGRSGSSGASMQALREALRALGPGAIGGPGGGLTPEAITELARRTGTPPADLMRLLGGQGGPEPANQGPQYLVFAFGDVECAIPTDTVQGVERLGDITRVPNTVDWVLGVVHLRGAIVSVVDLRRFVGLPSAQATPRTRLLVVSYRGMTVALLVDALLEMRAGGPDLRPIAGYAPAAPVAPFAVGVVDVEGRPVTLIDPQRLLFADKMRQYRADGT
jgi:purine-binding chemotaxis protein CheW